MGLTKMNEIQFQPHRDSQFVINRDRKQTSAATKWGTKGALDCARTLQERVCRLGKPSVGSWDLKLYRTQGTGNSRQRERGCKVHGGVNQCVGSVFGDLKVTQRSWSLGCSQRSERYGWCSQGLDYGDSPCIFRYCDFGIGSHWRALSKQLVQE